MIRRIANIVKGSGIIGLLVLSTACVTDLNANAKMVRQIDLSKTENCDFLGTVTGSEGSGWDSGHDRQGALNAVRNKVAELGGNAFVLNDINSSGIQSTANAEAYSCKWDT